MRKFFLDKENERKMELFDYLDSIQGKKELKEVIMTELNISSFLLEKIYSELQLDLKEFDIEDKFTFEADDTSVWLKKNTNVTSQQLEVSLIKNSLIFLIFTQVVLNEFESVNEYSDSNFVSIAFTYKKINDLKDYLTKFQMTINKNFQLEGDEKQVRLFLSSLYQDVYKQNFDIYPDRINMKKDLFISKLEEIRQKNLSEYKKIQIGHFINITLLRLENNFYQKDNSLFVEESNLSKFVEFQELKKILEEINIKIPENILVSEVDTLLAFLVSKECLTLPDYLPNVRNRKFSIYSLNFINAVNRNIPLLSPYIKKKEKQLDLIHFNALNFTSLNFEEVENISIKSFSNAFPQYMEFCKNYVEVQQLNHKGLKLDNFLLNIYLLMLVNREIEGFGNIPIYLYVDFSFGKKYTEYIINIIKNFTKFEIIYQDYINDKTNLILSDIHFERLDQISYIIWESPPETTDWEKFIDDLETIRQDINQ